MSNYCYSPIKGVDDRIAEALGYSPEEASLKGVMYYMATLRGLYDQKMELEGKPELDISDPEKVAAILRKDRIESGKKRADEINQHEEAGYVSSYKHFKNTIHRSHRADRINMVANVVMKVIDYFVEDAGSRERAINGYIGEDGNPAGGLYRIFEKAYETLQQKYAWYIQKAEEAETEETRQKRMRQAAEMKKVFDNWSAIVTYARIKLKVAEGLRIGNKLEYSKSEDPSIFGSNDIDAILPSEEESHKEGWQRSNDLESSFGNAGAHTRSLLSRCVIYDKKGKPEVDDMGFVRTMDPVRAHQKLQKLFRNIKSEEQLMRKLKKPGFHGIDENTGKFITKPRYKWLSDILTYLENNDVAKTQFFRDFCKNFQLYTCLVNDTKGAKIGLKRFFVKNLNKYDNILIEKYRAAVLLGNPVDETTIFNKNGNINWTNLYKLRRELQEWLFEDKSNPLVSNPDGKWGNAERETRADWMVSIAARLGVEMDIDTAEEILDNSSDTAAFKKELKEIYKWALKSYVNLGKLANVRENDVKADFAAMEIADDKGDKFESSLTEGSFFSLYRQGYDKAKGKEKGHFEEHMSKLLNIIEKNQESTMYESSALYKNSKNQYVTYYSDVNPCFMGDRIEQIQNFVNDSENGKENLRKFIEENYLSSSYFYDAKNKIILNKWIEELYNATFDNKPLSDNPFVSSLAFLRALGEAGNEFENFTDRKHMIDMLTRFKNGGSVEIETNEKDEKGKNKKEKVPMAWYSVFVLGDSNVSKYIKAKVYSEDEILKGLYHTYLQEKARWKLQDAASKVYGPISNFSKRGLVRRKSDGTIVTDSSVKIEGDYEIIGGEFTMLPFLNSDFKAPDGTVGKYSKMIEELGDGEAGVTEAIKSYMNDAFEVFRKDLAKMKFKKKNGFYIDLPQSYNVKEGTDELAPFRDFFFNHKFATIQQLQFLTVDNAFYGFDEINEVTGKIFGTTKDLQKRFKQEHAPGNPPSIDALDYDGNRYSENNIERVAYFDDISINGEVYNPEFMETVLHTYAEDQEAARKLIERGKLKPIKDDKAAEEARVKEIKAVMGSNYDIYKSYLRASLTDGQGFRTLKSYRKVMGMLAKWTPEMDRAYKRIEELKEEHADKEELPKEALAEIAKLGVVFQPVKPIFFGMEKLAVGDDFLFVPVQHKYSEAVIIPELLSKDSRLRELAEWMDDPNNNVDMVCSTKAVKVGIFGQTKLTDISKKGSLREAMDKAYIHQLDYSNYREQSNVPYHKQEDRLYGTQLRKLIMGGINMGNYYTSYISNLSPTGRVKIAGIDPHNNDMVELTGRNLVSFYNSLIMAQMQTSLNKFFDTTGDLSKLSKLLVENAINNSRNAHDDILGVCIEEFMEEGQLKRQLGLPLFEPGMNHNNEAFILSLFKKMVNRQEIMGNSLVQVSSLGINRFIEENAENTADDGLDGGLKYVTDKGKRVDGKEARATNIKWAECEVPWDLVYKTAREQRIDLKWEDYHDENGNLIYTIYADADYETNLLNAIFGTELKSNKVVRNSRLYELAKENGITVDELVNNEELLNSLGLRKVYKIEEVLPGVLDLIAYRIPTEREYSMMRLRIKRFSHPISGGTIKVPALATKVAGFDFDIDKLYLIRKEFRAKELTEEEEKSRNYEVWSNIYDELDILDKLKEAKKEGKEKFVAYMQEASSEKFIDTAQEREIEKVSSEYSSKKQTLYTWWKEAGIDELTGFATPEEAYSDYIARHPEIIMKYLKWEEYNPELSAQDNSPAARNNMLLQLTMKRLEDPETLRARVTPGGFAQASIAARAMRELLYGDLNGLVKNGKVDLEELFSRTDRAMDPEPDYDPSDPMTIIRYNQQNQIAGKLIGVFANHNTNHAFASLMDTFRLKKAIAFAGHSYSDLKNAPSGVDVARNMAELLAASVDAVKDPVLNFLNFTAVTADIGATLIRLGYTMNEVGMLLNQPIIKYISNEVANRDVTVDIVIEEICNQKKFKLSDIKTDANDFTMENLARNIIIGRDFESNDSNIQKSILDSENRAFVEGQKKVLALFSQISEASNEVSQFVTNTKFTASNAVPSTFGGVYQQMQRVDKYVKLCKKSKVLSIKVAEDITLPINNEKGLLNISEKEYWDAIIKNPFGYEQFMYDAERKMLRQLETYFPYENRLYSGIRDYITGLTKNKALDENTINSIHSEIMVYMLATRKGSDFDGEQRYKDTEYTVREYYTQHFAPELLTYLRRNPSMKKNALFQYMTPSVIHDDATNTDIIGLKIGNIGGLHESNLNELKAAWEELYEENPDLATDLFLYNFYKKGFNFSHATFLNLAPVALKQSLKVGTDIDGSELTYVDLMRKMLDKDSSFSSITTFDKKDFTIQHYINHADNRKLVFNAETSTLGNRIMSEKYMSGNQTAEYIVIDIGEKSTENAKKVFVQDFIENDSVITYEFRPAIFFKEGVYIAMSPDGSGVLENSTESTKMVYKRFELDEVRHNLVYKNPEKDDVM